MEFQLLKSNFSQKQKQHKTTNTSQIKAHENVLALSEG